MAYRRIENDTEGLGADIANEGEPRYSGASLPRWGSPCADPPRFPGAVTAACACCGAGSEA